MWKDVESCNKITPLVILYSLFNKDLPNFFYNHFCFVFLDISLHSQQNFVFHLTISSFFYSNFFSCEIHFVDLIVPTIKSWSLLFSETHFAVLWFFQVSLNIICTCAHCAVRFLYWVPDLWFVLDLNIDHALPKAYHPGDIFLFISVSLL